MSFNGNNDLTDLAIYLMILILIIIALFFARQARVDHKTFKNIFMSIILSSGLILLLCAAITGYKAIGLTIMFVPFVIGITCLYILIQNFYVHVWLTVATFSPNLFFIYIIFKATNFINAFISIFKGYVPIAGDIFTSYTMSMIKIYIGVTVMMHPEISDSIPPIPSSEYPLLKIFLVQYLVWGIIIFLISRAFPKKYE